MSPHPLTNFEMRRYYQNEPTFNGVYSRDNLPNKIKDGAYVINFDEYAYVGTYWIALFCKNNEISIVLELNMFLRRSKNLLDIKT